MARPRKYPPELLDRGARVVIESGRPIAHVARDLGVPAEALRRYVRRVEVDEGLRPDLPSVKGARTLIWLESRVEWALERIAGCSRPSSTARSSRC